jgi:ribosomal protein L32
MRFEMAMGSSHECSDCGHVFLANSDRCPNCGSYHIKPLHEVDVEQREKWDMETFPIHVWDGEYGDFVLVEEGDFSPYPKTGTKGGLNV